MRLAFSLLGLLACINSSTPGVGVAYAQHVIVSPLEGTNWQSNAEKYLLTLKGKSFDSKVDTTFLRCVRMNNYPCLKQRKGNWPHTPGPLGQDGAHDGQDGTNGHAIFDHPKWSIIADMRWFERNTKGGRDPKSAEELAEIYMPWCDTLGSKPQKADAGTPPHYWGKGCQVYVQTPHGLKAIPGAPAGFTGPLCRKPENGAEASLSQRQACNYPPASARAWTHGLGVTPGEKIILFDSSGHPTKLLEQLIARVVTNENGHYIPNAALLREAADAFVPSVNF